MRLLRVAAWISIAAATVEAGSGMGVVYPTNDPDLVIEVVITGIPFPTDVTFSPDGRLFFLEKGRPAGGGTFVSNVRVLDRNWALQSEPVIAVEPLHVDLEAGAIGLAFSPDYEEGKGGFVYVSHASGPEAWRISRFFENGAGVGADWETVMEFPDCLVDGFAPNAHNIENIHFGPNPVSDSPPKVLYVSIGDGGIGEDFQPPGEGHQAQEADNWCGGLFFFDPSNPPSVQDSADHVFCSGLRNAFDFCFHPFTETVYLTENSLDRNDEINSVSFGDNLGWPFVTGIAGDDRFKDPLHVIERPTAVTGISIYDGNELPERYRHQIFFCDYVQGEVHLLLLEDPADPNSRVVSHEYVVGHPDLSIARPLGRGLNGPFPEGLVDLTVGPDGWIYFCGGTEPFGKGTIYRLRRRFSSLKAR